MKQCHGKGAKFDGLKLKLKTEDLRISLTQERLLWALGIRKLLFGGTSSKSLHAASSVCLSDQYLIAYDQLSKQSLLIRYRYLISHSHWPFIPETQRNLR